MHRSIREGVILHELRWVQIDPWEIYPIPLYVPVDQLIEVFWYSSHQSSFLTGHKDIQNNLPVYHPCLPAIFVVHEMPWKTKLILKIVLTLKKATA